MTKRNPFKTKINDNTYILGRYCDTDSRGENTYFAVLICVEDGNRFLEPIVISESKWEGLCIGDADKCKETIQMIKDTSIRLRGKICFQ